MSLSKYSKRRGQFEALEAKQLFAADLVGGAAADLPDTPVVAGFDHGDLVAQIDPGDLSSVEMNPAATEELFGGYNFLKNANLGGQEGEPLMNTNLGDHLVVDGEGLYQRNELELAPRPGAVAFRASVHHIGGQEGEPVVDPSDCPELVDHVFQDYARDDFYDNEVHYFAVR